MGSDNTPSSPAKRNLAMTLATVVAVLVVVTALAVTVVVRATDVDLNRVSGADTDASVASSESPIAAAVPASAIVGSGYYFELPGIDWRDALDEARSNELEAMLDSIIILGPSLDLAQSNILVEALTAGEASDLDALRAEWKRNLSGDDGAVPDEIPDITIDGEPAIGVRFTDRENASGLLIDQIAYLTLHEGSQYSVALSLPSQDDAVSEVAFSKLLASWTWID